MRLSDFEHLVGHPFAAGTITIPAEESRKLDRVLGAPATPEGTLHPLHAFIATQRGIGVTIPEICALADFDIDEGPMMGMIEMELDDVIEPDTAYRVEGEVVDIVRKQGRSRGTFDLLTFRERLVDPDSGRTLATVTNSFVLPRGVL